MHRIAPLALGALLLLPALGLGAQEPEADLPGVFAESIDVRVVNIEVVVTDADGVRVPGLGPQDFRLKVDGEPQPVEYFSEVLGGETVAAGGDVPAAPGLEDAGASTSYLVFVDDYFSIARDRNRVLDGLIEDLEFLHPRDRMAVVAFDGVELEIVANWSHSRDSLTRALRQAKSRKSFGLQRMGELRSSGFGRASGLGRRLGGLDPLERSYALRLADQVGRGVSAAVATLRSFASPPGRKILVLLSGGWPSSPAELAVSSSGGRFEDGLLAAASGHGIPQYHRLLGPLADTANLLGYTIYPVDVPGTGGGFAGSGTGIFGGERTLHDSLSYLATETGGRALLNSTRERALERISDDTKSYYWLGFNADRAGDGSRHQVEVEILRPGLRVRSREGFVDLSRRAEVTMVVESALLFGHPAGERPLELRFGQAEKARRGIVAVPLEVGFPLDDVVLVPIGQDTVGAEVEVRVTVMDESGNRARTPVAVARIVGSELPAPGQMYWWQTTLLMRKRNHRVVVAVTDPVSGATFSSSAEVYPK